MTSPPSQHEEVVTPTTGGRVAFAGILVALALVQWVVLPFMSEWVQQHNAIDPAGAPLRKALLIAVGLAGATLMGVSGSLWHWLMAYRVYRSSLFPPRGYPIIAKTTVLRGPAAIRKGNALLVTGITLAVMTMAALYLFFYVFSVSTKLAILFARPMTDNSTLLISAAMANLSVNTDRREAALLGSLRGCAAPAAGYLER